MAMSSAPSIALPCAPILRPSLSTAQPWRSWATLPRRESCSAKPPKPLAGVKKSSVPAACWPKPKSPSSRVTWPGPTSGLNRRDRQADDQQQHRADARGPQGHRQIGKTIGVGKEELVALGREAFATVGHRHPEGLDHGGNDRPDDQPGNEQHRRGDKQEAKRPPAHWRDGPDLVRDGHSHELGSTFGATARYQPSLTAVSQSPPGKVGIDSGMMSAKRSRRSAET